MQTRPCSFFGVAALVCLPAFAQPALTSSSASTGGNVPHGTMRFSPRPFHGTPVTGAPYSAQRISEHVQTAADGTRFTNTRQQETIYRDSQGRTRTERSMMAGPNIVDAPLVVEINDPVSGVAYTLDTQHKVAHRVPSSNATVRTARKSDAMSAGAGVGGGGGGGSRDSAAATTFYAQYSTATIVQTVGASTGSSGGFSTSGAASAASAQSPPAVTNENLGSQLIEGVRADGSRMTQTWAVGSQGNDRPFQTTFETWFSAEIRETVLSRNFDPRSGENTMKLINIDRAEPSPNLFQPPADYTIVDESGSFDIPWTGTRSK